MLTKSEKQWLEEREPVLERYGCYSWPFYRMREDDFGYIGDLFDALEFSERVVARLAEVAAMQKKHHCCVDIDIPFHCPGWQSCAERMMSRKVLRPCEFEMLKGARIEVEEDMDGDADRE